MSLFNSGVKKEICADTFAKSIPFIFNQYHRIDYSLLLT
jgi:hypothetical protein